MKQKTETNPISQIQLSNSKLNLFRTCPRQYYYRYVAEPREKPVIWPGNLVGQVFHKAIEQSILQKKSGEEDRMILVSISGKFQEWYEEEIENNKKDYKISKEVKMGKDKFYRVNDRLMTNLVKFILSYFYTLMGDKIELIPEKEYLLPWEWDQDILLNGFVDILLISPLCYRIFDLKVTKEPDHYYFIDWDTATQKLIYEYFIYKTYNVFPKSFSFLVLDREAGTLFFKESHKSEKELISIQASEYFKNLNGMLKELKDFTLNPDMNLANPEENKCKWCIPYNTKCDLKWESQYIKAARKIKRAG